MAEPIGAGATEAGAGTGTTEALGAGTVAAAIEGMAVAAAIEGIAGAAVTGAATEGIAGTSRDFGNLIVFIRLFASVSEKFSIKAKSP